MAGSTSLVGAGIALGLGLFGVAALPHSSGQAGDTGLEPGVAAFFKDNDKLQVAVFLKDGHKGRLQVALTSEGRARKATQPREVNQAEGVGRYLFEIPISKAEAGK